MNAAQFRDALERLDIDGEQTARVLNVSARVVRRWSSGEYEVPFSIAKLLRFVLEGKLTLADICHHGKTLTSRGRCVCVDCHRELTDEGQLP